MREPALDERVHGSPELRRRQATARRLATALARVAVVDADGVPATGPVVLAVNHRSVLDGPLLFGFTPRPVNCLVKAEAVTPRMATLLRVRRPIARVVFGDPMQVERHPDDLPLNRRLVAATTERIRSALADLVAGAHEAWSAEPEGMVA